MAERQELMRLTTRSEYALLALLYLARRDSAEPVAAEVIAKAQGIPLNYLEQILLALKRSRFVASSKGQRGGFRLARSADEIVVAEVVRLFDGALAPTHSASEYFYRPTPIARERKTLHLMREIRDYVAQKLETTRLADIA